VTRLEGGEGTTTCRRAKGVGMQHARQRSHTAWTDMKSRILVKTMIVCSREGEV